ncbi:MAG: glycosyltransferase family 39 protein [Candidatus Obscuribacterales bacterium]|nr:glycosyltransferase family 39 protein [Candidatus Obscuribacterales bacterium]
MSSKVVTKPASKKPIAHANETQERGFISPVVIVTAIFVVANITWSYFNHGMPDWDAAGHVLNGFTYRDLLKHPQLTSDWMYKFLSVNYLYPPAVYILNGSVKSILGIAPWVDAAIKAFYVALLSISIYGITKSLLKDTVAAVVAMVIINCYPQISFLSNQIMLDFPMVAMVALSLWALIIWQFNPSIKNTLLLGLAIGSACMTKQLAGAFILLPVGMAFLQMLFGKRFADCGKLIGAGIIPTAMALPWLIVTYPSLQKLAQYNTNSIGQLTEKLSFSWVFSNYLGGLPAMMTPILLCGFIASLLIIGGKTHRELRLIAASAIGGLLLISTLSWAYPLDRYAAPALLAPAIYTAAGFAYAWLKSKSLVLRIAYAALSGIAILQFLLFNYAPYPLPAPAVLAKALPHMGIALRTFHDFNIPATPEKSDWGQIWALEQIRKVDNITPVYLQLMPNSMSFNVHTMEYAAKLVKSPVVATTMRQWSVKGDTLEFSPQKALYYHWYLLKTGDQGNIFANRESQIAFDRLTDFIRTSGKFKLMGMRSLPDHSICYLYRQYF